MEKKWRCTVCGYVHTGDNPPEKCPLCKAPASKFVEIKEDANEISCEIAEAYRRIAYEEADHAARFAELLGEVVWDTKTNLEKRMHAEADACADKKRIATKAKQLNLDAIHDTVHEMCKDEARHGQAFEGLYKRFFGEKK